MKTEKLQAAFDALTGPVTQEYSQAVTASWQAHDRESKAAVAMTEALKDPSCLVRQAIKSALRVPVDRLGGFIEFNQPRCYFVNHGEKPEVKAPIVDFSVWIPCRIKITVDFCPKSVAELQTQLARVRGMLESVGGAE